MSAAEDLERSSFTDSILIVSYVDVRQLNPGAGELAKACGERVLCGTITGTAEGRSDDLAKWRADFVKWRVRAGRAGCLRGWFRADPVKGEAEHSGKAYVPELLGRELAAQRFPVEFRAVIFAEPDTRPASRMGFRYTWELHTVPKPKGAVPRRKGRCRLQ